MRTKRPKPPTPAVSQDGQERRSQKFQRLKKRWGIKWRTNAATPWTEGVTIDISTGGMGISASELIEIGCVVEFEVDMGGDGRARGKGRVVWAREHSNEWGLDSSYRFGIEFDEYQML